MWRTERIRKKRYTRKQHKKEKRHDNSKMGTRIPKSKKKKE